MPIPSLSLVCLGLLLRTQRKGELKGTGSLTTCWKNSLDMHIHLYNQLCKPHHCHHGQYPHCPAHTQLDQYFSNCRVLKNHWRFSSKGYLNPSPRDSDSVGIGKIQAFKKKKKSPRRSDTTSLWTTLGVTSLQVLFSDSFHTWGLFLGVHANLVN